MDKNKYDMWEEVYYIKWDKIMRGQITGMYFGRNAGATEKSWLYRIGHNMSMQFLIKEENVFRTKEEIIESIQE